MEAHRLEHGISEVVGDRMEEILGFPDTLPAWRPHPGQRRQHPWLPDPHAGGRGGGRCAHLASVTHNGDAPLLRYLAELGLRPGARITLQQRAPFRGPLHVVVGDQPQIIGHEVASLLWVEQA
ncbi:MAG: FeoA domain-containing protein [Anaerolineae bacterium]|nr:FeoA domain-containing protein [Anaerolineae bacterium]